MHHKPFGGRALPGYGGERNGRYGIFEPDFDSRVGRIEATGQTGVVWVSNSEQIRFQSRAKNWQNKLMYQVGRLW